MTSKATIGAIFFVNVLMRIAIIRIQSPREAGFGQVAGPHDRTEKIRQDD